MSDEKPDPAMTNLLNAWDSLKESGWTMQKIGEMMGYPSDSARKSVSQFLKSKDPRVSMLRRFAKAAGIKLSTLIKD